MGAYKKEIYRKDRSKRSLRSFSRTYKTCVNVVIAIDIKVTKPLKLPTLEQLEKLFDYEPFSGLLTYKNGDEAGSFNKQLYRIVCIQGKKYYVHRIVWKMFYRKDPGALLIDHINGCPHDNSIENLRRVKNRTNLRNNRARRLKL